MSTDSEDVLDDASIDDPWERMDRLGRSLQVIADKERADKVTGARRLLESLEDQVMEGDDGDD